MKKHGCQYLGDCLWTSSDVTGSLDIGVFMLGLAGPILKAALVGTGHANIFGERTPCKKIG
jgi:hypothetical protein